MTCANHAAVDDALQRCARCGRDYCADCLIALQGSALCAACKEDYVRDYVSGVPLRLPLASFRRRVAALLIDRGLLAIVSIGLAVRANEFFYQTLYTDYRLSIRAGWLTYWTLYALYVVFEAKMLQLRGATIGKLTAGIKVVGVDGQPLRRAQAWWRAIIRGLFLWALQIINYAPATVTAEHTCIHDLLARTRVVQARD